MSAEILQFVSVANAPNRIRELRAEAGLSQQAVADRLSVSKVTISDLELGKMQLTLDYMGRLANVLEVSAADLLPRSMNADALSAKERALIDRLRDAEAEQQDQLMRVADVMIPWRGPDKDDKAA